MNICEITSGYRRIPPEQIAPVEIYILNISRQMSMRGHNITIIDRKYSKADPLQEHIDGVTITRLKSRTYHFGFLAWFRPLARFLSRVQFALDEVSFTIAIRRYLSHNRFDIIHIHSPVMGLPLVMFNPRIRKKLVYTSHMNIMLYDPSVLKPSLWEKAHTILNYAFMRRSRMVIALNDQLRTKCIEEGKVKPENVELITSGTDVELFHPDIDIGDIRDKFDLNGKFSVLFVGKIDKVKGVACLVRAANIVVNEYGYHNTRFVLVGPFGEVLSGMGKIARNELSLDYYSRQIWQMIINFKLQSNIILTGLVSSADLRRLYAACDIFALPSLAETFPMVVVEAMACGKPVVAFRVGGTALQVSDSENGFLVSPGAEQELAEKIKYMIDNPAEVVIMGQASRRRAEKEFSWTTVADNLLEVFEKI